MNKERASAQLGFLKHNSESSVFLGFPDSTRKVIAIKVCDDILKNDPGPEALSSSAHVRVLFECIGQAFGLSIDSQTAVIIGKAISVYENWFFTESAQPLPIKEDEQVFFRDMFRHFSLLFLPRAAASSEGDSFHGKLCLRVLEIFSRVGSALSDRLSRDTWEVLLKIVLGISDSLLKIEEDHTHLADELTPKLLEVLVQLFLTSRTDNNRMWDHLTNLMRGWVHRQATIIQWGATSLALTRNVLNILYGPSYGFDYVLIALPHLNISIRGLSREYTLYVWYRALHFLRDLERIQPACNYITAMCEISKLVTCFLESPISDIPTEQSVQHQIQRRNTLLHIVGPWLFEAINTSQPGYDRGKAHALSALCDIFGSASHHAKFDSRYLACFYRGLEVALTSESNLLRSTVLMRAQEFFQKEMTACRILIQPCLTAVRHVLTSQALTGIDVSIIELRRASIILLASTVPLPNHFSATPLGSIKGQRRSGQPDFKSLVETMTETIPQALQSETDPNNQQMLLWTAYSFLLEHLDSLAAEFGSFLIQYMLTNLLSNEQWNTQVCVAVLHNLVELAFFDRHFEPKTCRIVVSQLCVYIERNMNRVASVSGKEPNEDLITEPIYTIIRWILARQWIATDLACLYQVLNVVELGLTGKYNPDLKDQVYFSPTEKIREAAACLFSNLFNHFGQFPTRSGDASYNCSLKVESDFPDPFAYYIFDDNLLSINHIPRSQDIRTNLILRNPAGRFIWRCHLNYFVHQVIDPPPLPAPVLIPPLQTPISGQSSFPVLPLAHPDFERLLLKDMSPEQLSGQTEIVKLATDLSKVDTSSSGQENSSIVYLRRPVAPPSSESDFVSERLFLSHLGLSWLDNRSRLCQSAPTTNFGEVDDQNSRLCLTAAVAFFPKGADIATVLGLNHGSPDYENFLSAIGWSVNLAEHRGFTGGLDPEATPRSPYFADALSETMFQVFTLSRDPNKLRFLEISKVVISWVEDIDAPLPSCLQSVPINILIYPLPSKLYRIRIITTDNIIPRGPLLDGTIVSKHLLGHCARQTAISYARLFAGTFGDPISRRSRLINDLINTNRAPVPLHKFFSSQYAGELPV